MVTTPRSGSETANLGVFRPPLIYLASIAAGLAFHWVWPRPPLSGVALAPLGAILVVASLLLFGLSVQRFRAAGTPVPARKPTTAIVRAGPYRFSRNPIYLAFSLFQLGLAFWINSLGLLMTLIPAVALMALVVVPREERYLEARFPSEYSSYRAAVRRWL